MQQRLNVASGGGTPKAFDEEMSFDENGQKSERMGTRKHPVAFGKTNHITTMSYSDRDESSGIGSGVKSLEANGKKGK